MTKQEYIDNVAKETGLSKRRVEELIRNAQSDSFLKRKPISKEEMEYMLNDANAALDKVDTLLREQESKYFKEMKGE